MAVRLPRSPAGPLDAWREVCNTDRPRPDPRRWAATVICEDSHFRLVIDGETAAVPRATTSDVRARAGPPREGR